MIKCKICGKECGYINNAHLSLHNMTPQQYKDMFGEKSLMDDNRRKERSIRAKERLKDPVYKDFLIRLLREASKKMNTKEMCEKHSKFMIKRWSDSEYMEKQKGLWTPERRELESKRVVQWFVDNPEQRKVCGENLLKLWEDEEFRNMQTVFHSGYNKNHPEVIENLQNWHKEHPDCNRGENSVMWKGGNVKQRRRRSIKRHNMNYVPLFDNPFPSDVKVDMHHINDMLVVPMPRTIHMDVCRTGRNVPEHRERCNLWMYYLYGIDFDLLTREAN